MCFFYCAYVTLHVVAVVGFADGFVPSFAVLQIPVRQDPYVRKTAAVCVAKLYDINAELVEDQGFLQILRDLICDPNPTVRATINTVAAHS